MAKLIIGLAGEMASGKTTVARHLVKKHGGESYRFSTILRDIAERLGIEENRDNLATMSTVLRGAFGEDILAKAVRNDVADAAADMVVIDGARRFSDIEYLKELPLFKLVYIKVSQEKRYQRVTKRRENADDAAKTFEEFKRDNEAEAERQIPELEAHADIVIENDGVIGRLYKQVDTFV